MNTPTISHKFYRNLIFAIGIIATFAYRIIIVLNYYSQFWVEVAWYVGTLGFVWYFAHRYRVENAREKLIANRQLIDKIENNKTLDQTDTASLVYILKGLRSSKARWNYIVIFIFSLLAFIYAVYQNILNYLAK